MESPCYCSKEDESCMGFQNMVLPNNPCVEDSMADFVAGGSIATASDRQLPKVKSSKQHSSTRRNQKKLKEKTITTTSTTTTTPVPDENDVSKEVEEEQEIVSTEDTSAGELEEPEMQAIDNNTTATSKSSERKPKTTMPTEIRTKIPPKGIKVSTNAGTSTAKVISGQPMVTQTPPPKEGILICVIANDLMF